MPVVTALRAERRGRVAIELDGKPWRSIPLEAVLRSGLEVGRELDRPRARQLRRELRRLEGLAVAARSVRTRDLSAAQLAGRLERAGVAPVARAETLDVLDRAGVVDDRRVGSARAAVLAERGYGDAWIRWDLGCRGIASELVEDAVGALEPESARAARIVRGRGGGRRTAQLLARRGFGEDAVEAAATASVAADG